MDLFTRVPLWIFVSLLAITSPAVCSNCCPPKPKCCDEKSQLQLTPGYNASSRIDVRGCWDVYASGSFTYFQPSQDNIELGDVYESSSETENFDLKKVNQKFGYKPGFKVALGMNLDYDNWSSLLQYGWFRGSDTSTVSLNPDNADNVNFLPAVSSLPVNGQFYHATQKWKLHIDLLDWELARTYYVGTKLSFCPSFGVRTAWIRQNLASTFVGTSEARGHLSRASNCWGIGPRACINTNWAIGEGFRFFGNGSANILFTQYTKLKFNTEGSSSQQDLIMTRSVQRKLNCLRTHLDLEIGLGWGSYFDCNNWHLDLSAGYGFQVFFNQNMLRLGNFSYDLPRGDLYVQGLTATLRFDF